MATQTVSVRIQASGWVRSSSALWTGFGVVHAWLTVVGVVLLPSSSFYDVHLYRHWVVLGLGGGPWPVLDQSWVYPVGALLPMLVPAGLAGSIAGYTFGWCVLVTSLDAIAVAALLRRGVRRGAWWWLAFLLLLGPVAMGRIDAILAPIVIVALLLAAGRPRVAAALITLGAWIKVAPGVLLLPLLLIARRPVRDVVVPAAAVCAAIVAAVGAGGGLPRVASFLVAQNNRGLQVEAVAASPWTIAALVRDDVVIALNRPLTTWEITGPGTAATARAMDYVLPLAVAALAVLLWRARSRPVDVLLWGSLALATLLIVVNKVGSPQYIGWLAPPIAVALTIRGGDHDAGRAGPALDRIAVAVLAIALATQLIFPHAYNAVLASNPLMTAVLVLRNAALVALLVAVCWLLARGGRPEVEPVSPGRA